MHLKYPLFLIFLFVLFFQNTQAQNAGTFDTLRLTLADADSAFLQKSFVLLAAKYNVGIADAAVIQAKLYPNPNLSIDQGAYNPGTMKWFDISKTGETAVSLDQVIILARKRNKQINLSTLNAKISTYQFFDLIRTLRYELHSSFYRLYYLQRSMAVYDREIEPLQSLIEVYKNQYDKGNIAFKELARLQALQFDLENERMDLFKEASEQQSNLRLLTGDTLPAQIKPLMEEGALFSFNANSFNYMQLVDSGMINRADLMAAKTDVESRQANLALQKSLRVPDLTLGANWDRQGSYIYNYNSLSLAMDLPFLNRNQGNIKIAEHQVNQGLQLEQQAELIVKTEIAKAYSQFVESDRLYKSASSQFNSDYEKLLDGIMSAYRNHTISLLEFIDYYETYKNSKIDFNKLQNSRLDALENLNLATGTTLIK